MKIKFLDQSSQSQEKNGVEVNFLSLVGGIRSRILLYSSLTRYQANRVFEAMQRKATI